MRSLSEDERVEPALFIFLREEPPVRGAGTDLIQRAFKKCGTTVLVFDGYGKNIEILYTIGNCLYQSFSLIFLHFLKIVGRPAYV